MNKVIIYPQENNTISIVYPSNDLHINDVARKDVPNGIAYKIIDITSLPLDNEFRGAWEADFSNPDGYGIGAEAWFAEQAAKNSEVAE